jgi:hypothetical protein
MREFIYIVNSRTQSVIYGPGDGGRLDEMTIPGGNTGIADGMSDTRGAPDSDRERRLSIFTLDRVAHH